MDGIIDHLNQSNACTLAMSDHADFNETIDYVKTTGAKKVITDAYRGRNADTLALELSKRLNIEAEPSLTGRQLSWGK